MYVSRPVRAIRDEPVPDEEVVLLLRTRDGASVERVAASVDDLDGVEVDDELAFGTLRVRARHERVADVCEVDGLAAVETDDALATTLDGAGEDVEY